MLVRCLFTIKRFSPIAGNVLTRQHQFYCELFLVYRNKRISIESDVSFERKRLFSVHENLITERKNPIASVRCYVKEMSHKSCAQQVTDNEILSRTPGALSIFT